MGQADPEVVGKLDCDKEGMGPLGDWRKLVKNGEMRKTLLEHSISPILKNPPLRTILVMNKGGGFLISGPIFLEMSAFCGLFSI